MSGPCTLACGNRDLSLTIPAPPCSGVGRSDHTNKFGRNWTVYQVASPSIPRYTLRIWKNWRDKGHGTKEQNNNDYLYQHVIGRLRFSMLNATTPLLTRLSHEYDLGTAFIPQAVFTTPYTIAAGQLVALSA